MTCKKCKGEGVIGKKKEKCPRCAGSGEFAPPAETDDARSLAAERLLGELRGRGAWREAETI